MNVLVNDEPWVEEALCAQIGDDALWFPENGGASRPAKRICLGSDGRPPCPVQAKCLAYALRNGELFGVWGGYSALERHRMANGLPPGRRVSNLPSKPRRRRANGHGWRCQCTGCRNGVAV